MTGGYKTEGDKSHTTSPRGKTSQVGVHMKSYRGAIKKGNETDQGDNKRCTDGSCAYERGSNLRQKHWGMPTPG